MNVFSKLLRNTLWQTLSFLPKQSRKAVCQSFYGRGFSDSPKAVAQELLRRGWTVYWTVKGPEDAASLRKIGADAALIGEAFMRSKDKRGLLRAMREAAR